MNFRECYFQMLPNGFVKVLLALCYFVVAKLSIVSIESSNKGDASAWKVSVFGVIPVRIFPYLD